MDEARFMAEMNRAQILRKSDKRSDYWDGFTRGLRHAYHGALFGTEQEHAQWLSLATDGGDESSRERGCGYRDGLAALLGPGAEFGGAKTVQTIAPSPKADRAGK